LTSLLQQWLNERQDLGLQETTDKNRIPQQHISLTPGGSGISVLGSEYGDGLRMLSATSALVLLIACANVANLLLARVNQFQISVRAALGATRVRLIGQTLTEGVLLALAGGALGVGVAYGGARAILLLAFRGAKYIPIAASPSPTVLGFALVLSLLTGIVFSAVPSWILSKTNPIDSLRGGSRFTADRAAMPRNAMVVIQAALSFVMLAAAGLLTASLWRLEHQAFGFQADGRLIVKVNPSFTDYTDERLAALYSQLDARLNNLPGVQSASFSLYSPMEGDNWQSGVSVEGRPIDLRNDSASWDRVGPRYFETIGTRLIEGRTIDERDTPASTHIAVVNQAFVRKYLSSSDPIGKHFGLGDQSHTRDFEIVGVVADAKYSQADRDVWPFFFIPYLQSGHYDQPQDINVMRRSNYVQSIELRFTGRVENLEQKIRETLSQLDANLTVLSVASLNDQISGNFNQQRLIARLTTLYGVIAVLLAGIGLYGVAAYGVKRRTTEIGVRMALGANRKRVVGMVLRTVLVQMAIGLAVGIPAALAAGQLLSAKLYGVTGHDVFVMTGSAFVVFVAALLAAIVPARRAASVDPMTALRSE
jgi:predicted permease